MECCNELKRYTMENSLINKKINILLIEDEPFDAGLISRVLKKGDVEFAMYIANSKASFELAINDFSPDLIISDHSIPLFDLHDALKIIKDTGLIVPFILVNSAIHDDLATELFKAGIDGYVNKRKLQQLPLIVKHVIQKHAGIKQRLDVFDNQNKEFKRLHKLLQLTSKTENAGIWRWDIENDELNCDEVMYDLYQLSKHEPGYKSWLSKVYPDDKQQANVDIQSALKGEKEYNSKFRIVLPDGNIRFIKAAGNIDRNKKGEPVWMTSLHWDITEQVTQVDTIKKQDLLLQEIVHIQSHLVRGPLARVMGLVDIFIAEERDDIRNEIADFILQSANELDEIIKDITTKASLS